MKLWLVSMECAGIAEAGGVKNVTFSICKEFSEAGHIVTLFIPVFKCTTWNSLEDITHNVLDTEVTLCNKVEKISYSKALCKNGGFNVVFINHPSFAEKEGVYTYTENEQNENPAHKKGDGHTDMLFKDILFQKAVSEYMTLISEENLPDIVHCQDASTAVLPGFIKQKGFNYKIESVVTIHNAGPYYHHEFKNLTEALWYTELDKDILEKSKNGERVEPFLIAVESGANLSTVSEVYAEELIDPANADLTDGLSPIFNTKGISIKGITNGFDYDRYNPSDKNISKLPFEFNPEKNDLTGKYSCRKYFVKNIAVNSDFKADGIKKIGTLNCSSNCDGEVYIAYHGRVTSQKGLTVLNSAIPDVVKNNPNVRFVIAGQGEPGLENSIKKLTEDFAGKVLFLNGYNQSVVRLVTAMADFIVLPSFFEPCGLEDFIAQSFGTLPVAHKTGGLNKIEDYKTGFLYEKNTPESLVKKLTEVISVKKENEALLNNMIVMAAKSVHSRYYWKNVVEQEYLKYFKEILKK